MGTKTAKRTFPFIPASLAGLAEPLGSLVPFPGNARRGQVEEIAGSLRRYGQYRPIVANTGDVAQPAPVILVGNNTYHAMCRLKQEGATHIATTFVSVDAETASRINLIDNKLSDDSGYDVDALMAQLRGLPSLEDTGYTSADLDALLMQLAPVNAPTLASEPQEDDEDGGDDEDAPAATGDGRHGLPSITTIDTLVIGKHRIPMTPAESRAIQGALRAHIDKNGTNYGFVRSLFDHDL